VPQSNASAADADILPIAARPIRVERAARPDLPHCVVLPALTRPLPERPPVRIFLGTERAQVRAQRIFFYSVERVRDTSREYRIYLMKELAGFDRQKWRTGFTNYRFAIPEFAGREGRAIYNDVDQIYLEDPAHLFDLPMGEHGYLAVSDRDTSVMLLDCARMAQWWNLDSARHQGKRALADVPATQPGLYGALDAGWNARDDEFARVQPRVLHYTALHQQPWQPTPRDYSYHPNPLGDLWFELERAADAEHYGPFRPEVPSPWFDDSLNALGGADSGRRFTASAQAQHLLETFDLQRLGWWRPAGQATSPPPLTVSEWSAWAPDEQWPEDVSCEAVAVTGVLEHLPGEDVPWYLDRLAGFARRLLYVGLELSAERHADNSVQHNSDWWRQQLRRVTLHHRHLAWHLDIRRGEKPGRECIQRAAAGERGANAPPRVWLLLGAHQGDNIQMRTLARRLGWPVEEKLLDFATLPSRFLALRQPSVRPLTADSRARLAPPWPDVVIFPGWRSVNVARWIQQCAAGRTQLVSLGRPRAPLHWFDLIVTTPQYGLPARANVLHNLLPLNTSPAEDEATLAAWREHLASLPHPWIGVLVGGDTGQQRFEANTARLMAQAVNAHARRLGGALLVTTSPRTSPAASAAFQQALDVPYHFYDWQAQQGEDNPYRTYLALANAFVVSGDSASMLAETLRTGRSVHVYRLPRYLATPGQRLSQTFHDLMSRRARQTSQRGTPRQQDWKGQLFDRLFVNGWVGVPRDLERLVSTLRVRDLLHELGGNDISVDDERLAKAPPPLPDELQATAEEIRLRIGERQWREA